jgi:hypothetical protein
VVTVACILDEFSWENFRHEGGFYPLFLRGWQRALAERPPDFLFVESAWLGPEGRWGARLAYREPTAENPIFAILDHCRDRGIPTVFWNKEDPPHYARFIDLARRFDFVFTTDANSVPRYRVDAPHARVDVLPFAVQPALHHPVDRHRFPHLGDVCFAGGWYPQHPERHADARRLLDAARRHDLVIYDRHARSPTEGYPAEFRRYVRGSLSYRDTVERYRQFHVFLNVNSVRDSPTMFSRRVLEILACGTPVVSAPSVAIAALLGDRVPMPRTDDEARDILARLISDERERDRLVIPARREIFARHTARHRLDTILRAIGLSPPSREVAVTVVGNGPRARENFERQGYPHKTLVSDAAEAVTDIVAVMTDTDFYGEHYLVDAVQALEYAQASCVGQVAGMRDRYVDEVDPATRVWRRQARGRTYATSPYNFVRGGRGGGDVCF